MSNVIFMKRTIVLFVLLMILQVGFAQYKSEWKLSTHTWNGAGWTGKWEYKYDSSFHLKEVKYFQDKKLFTVSKNFTHNSDGNITSYEDEYLQGADPQKFSFAYSADGKLKTKKIIFYKQKKENYTLEESYEWTDSKVTVTKNVFTKKGNSTSKIIYNLDKNKNITSRENRGEYSSTTDNYKEIDNTPNPACQVDYPYDGEVKSPNNSTISFSTSAPSTRKVKLNKAGLTESITETINNGTYNIVNVDTYTYVKGNVKGK